MGKRGGEKFSDAFAREEVGEEEEEEEFILEEEVKLQKFLSSPLKRVHTAVFIKPWPHFLPNIERCLLDGLAFETIQK